jgi:flavin-dependent dehydrogenase
MRLSILSLLVLPSLLVAAPKRVLESARQIPLVADVDVVVVGGGSGGVAAAAEVAKTGAKVFLAAPRMYLGEDLCAPYRIWLKPDEEPDTPLAKAMFADPLGKRGLQFQYTASLPSMDRHIDSTPPHMLNDAQWGTAFTQSVQYNGDVSITADLGEAKDISRVAAKIFQAPNNFDIRNIAVSFSLDGKAWTKVGDMPNPDHLKGSYVEKALGLELPASGQARYVKFDVTKGEKAGRVLIGELQVFSKREEEAQSKRMRNTTPMLVKSSLEEALIAAGVQFVYGSPATDVLRDGNGRLAGIVIANRAGRQAIRAKAIVDATGDGWFAQLAGAKVTFPAPGTQEFRRIVVGGKAHQGEGIVSCDPIPVRAPVGGTGPAAYGSGGFGQTVQRINGPMRKKHESLLDYTLRLPVQDTSFAARAEAEQMARDLTFDPEQVEEAETLLPATPPVVDASGVAGLYVAPTGAAPSILATLHAGTALGTKVAEAVKNLPKPQQVAVAGLPAASATETKGTVGENLQGLRPGDKPTNTVPSPARALPVLGEYDVVVVGGGTSGAPAGISAARSGAKTLVVEYLDALGGVGTTGLIGIYCAGYRKGFTTEIDKGIKAIGSPTYIVAKQEYWRRETRKAGGDIWFRTLGCGAYRVGDKVAGVVVATPEGRGVVLAKVVIDGTGNADVAAAAGAETAYNSPRDAAMQGTGIPYRAPGASYINTDWTYVDEVDMVDVTTALIAAKRLFPGAYDLGQLIDTRERRRIVGDYTLTPLDIINHRHFPDTIQISQGGRLDKHGPPVTPYYFINNYLGGIAYTPYRCLLPKGLDGILVVGIGLSADRDAIPSVRMQPGMQNLGYAAGVAAAMAADGNLPTRKIDLKALQKHLIAKECLTPEVADHADSYPLSETVVQAAVIQLRNRDYEKLGIIMAQPETSLPMLRKAYDSAPSPEGKLRVAHVLGMMGDATGIDTLLASIRQAKDLGTENISHYFPNITWQDSYILAAGYSHDSRTLPVLLEKAETLERESPLYWKHAKVITQALEALGDPRGAGLVADFLKTRGTAIVAAEDAIQGGNRRSKTGTLELVLARVLYNLGDVEGLGEKRLREFARDVRGHYRSHALAVLAQGPGSALRK